MKKIYAIALVTVLCFQSCAPNHDLSLENYLGENNYVILNKKAMRQDDAVNANSTEYTVQTTKTFKFIKESGEEGYRIDTVIRHIVVGDNGTAYDK
jgi:hypothetical protein